ncbi:MAG: type VI secretion system baseplate subunit TssG [Acidobacteriota bacterium]|nr:type VI secretion system baseplate subunit TssG [Acidobacteriota bacterium]
MAATSGTQAPDLNDSPLARILREEPCSFEFFQAVALLERLRPGCQPVGRFTNPEDEAVHFSANAGLAFPASQVHDLDWPEEGPAEMKVNFMGLTGPMGVLPYTYSELILERLRAKDDTLASFLDIFNHRMISFFYRAWEKYRFPVTYALGDDDLFTHHLRDLVGLGTSGLEERQAVPDEALLHYTGLLAMHARSAAALEGILSDYFEVPVEVEEFVGAWYALAPGTECRMDEDEGESQQLGGGAVVGDQIWDQQSRARIKLGPMSLAQYREFLPDGSAFGPLRSIARFFVNDGVDFEVQLILKREEVPNCQIDLDGEARPRLGWASWLKSAPLGRDPGDTILNL